MIQSRRLSDGIEAFEHWDWPQVEASAKELLEERLSQGNLEDWLGRWSFWLAVLQERLARLQVEAAQDTGDQQAEERLNNFHKMIYTPAMATNQEIKRRLLESGLAAPDGFEIAMRNLRVEAELFCAENLQLATQEEHLIGRYNQICGSQTAQWQGREVSLYELEAMLQDTNRETRRQAWQLRVERQLQDRDAIDELWAELVRLRTQIARNAGYADYNAYRWRQLRRFDYTKADCERFHRAIEAIASPAIARIYERYRRNLGSVRLRPWDLEVDPLCRPPLQPFKDISELEGRTAAIIQQIDPQLGSYFETMQREGLLDLANRPNKAPHGWCQTYYLARRPFIFMNATGWHRDVMMLLHEAGHAFHVFEMASLPYTQQMEVPAEFMEVASMAMELLASPYLSGDRGGFYPPEDADRARVKHLEDAIIVSWPYIAAMDVFQHWAYANPDEAVNGRMCGYQWEQIWQRFMPGVDWEGLEDGLRVAWQSVPHFFGWPLSGSEYSIAQLGAVQIWRNAKTDLTEALRLYRQALALGGTKTLPELYEAAGARFAFDEETLRQAVSLMEREIDRLLESQTG